jgi:hypothetical protein
MENIFKKFSLLAAAIFFIFSCAVFAFFFREVKMNNEKLQIALQKWQQKEDERNELDLLERSLKSIEQEKMNLDTHFIQSSDIVPFLDYLENLGKKIGIGVEITSADSVHNDKELIAGLKASGSFEQLYKFITLIENSHYEIEIENFELQTEEQIQVSKNEKKNTIWSAVVKIRLISYKK